MLEHIRYYCFFNGLCSENMILEKLVSITNFVSRVKKILFILRNLADQHLMIFPLN